MDKKDVDFIKKFCLGCKHLEILFLTPKGAIEVLPMQHCEANYFCTRKWEPRKCPKFKDLKKKMKAVKKWIKNY